jgi:hypothetical protein
MLTDKPNVYGCHDPQCLDSTWDHECPQVPAVPEGPLSAQDWKEIFSTVPPYPMDLPDELRRTIAQAAITIRQAAEDMERGQRTGSLLDYQMPMSLLGTCIDQMARHAP